MKKSYISNDYLCVGIQHTFLSRWLIGFVASFVTRLSFSIVRETTGDFFWLFSSALLLCGVCLTLLAKLESGMMKVSLGVGSLPAGSTRFLPG